MRRAVRAVVVAALVALPFSVAAAAPADAACVDLGAGEICQEGMGGIGLDIPGVLHLCIKLQPACP